MSLESPLYTALIKYHTTPLRVVADAACRATGNQLKHGDTPGLKRTLAFVVLSCSDRESKAGLHLASARF